MFPSFLSLSSAWLFALLVPLTALYFLKLKRPRQVIPSLVLWRQVMNDQRVNSPFQRFKRNLLLLLQILLLTLLVLAAMQPLLRHRSSVAGRLPVLIDTSASMAALDKPGGISRLDAVKRRVGEMLDALPADQQISLIAFGKTARRLTEFTNNARELRTALDAIDVEDVPGDLEEALRLAQGLARSAPFDRVLLLSDGNFPARTNFELPFKIDYERVAPAGGNFGVTACSARRGLSGQWEVFVQLGGSAGAEATTGSVELRQDGAVVATEPVTLVAESAPGLAFKVAAQGATTIEVRLIPGGFDSLASDNSAWLTLPAPRPLDVFVPPRMAAFRHALEALDGVRLWPQDGMASPSVFDLALTDQAGDLPLAGRVVCTVGFVPEELAKMVAMQSGNSAVVDWRRDSPLLRHVVLDDVIFMDEPRMASAVSEPDFASAGFAVLAQGAHGPLLLEKRERDGVRIHALFAPERSTLPYRVGFPIFVSNLVQTAQGESKLAEVSAAQTGVLPSIAVAAGSQFEISGPSNFHREERSDGAGELSGVPAPRAGEYLIRGPGALDLKVGASLLSVAETDLAGVDALEFSDQIKVQAASGPSAMSDRSLWWPVACAAFATLLVEWWYFQRCPTVAERRVTGG